jgi:hypothetical protein
MPMLRAAAILPVGLLLALAPAAGGQQEPPPNGLLFFAEYGSAHAPRGHVYVSLQTSRGAMRSFSLFAVSDTAASVPPDSRGRTVGEMYLLRSRNPGPNLPSRPYVLTMPKHPGRARVELIRDRRRGTRMVLRPTFGRRPLNAVLSVYNLPPYTLQVEIVFQGRGAHVLSIPSGCPAQSVMKVKVDRSGAPAGTALSDSRCG